MADFAKNAVFKATKGVESNPVPDGCVIYNPARERVHFLNPTAVVVYELCAAGLSVEAIENYVGAAFSMETVPSEDVGACLALLVDEGLVRPCP